MPEYPIPDEAVDAAGEALYQHQVEWLERDRFFECGCNEHGALGPLTHLGEVIEHQSRAVLAAAAPHIAAAALRQAAQQLQDAHAAYFDAPGAPRTYGPAAWLRRRADDLDGRQPTPDTRDAVQARIDALRPGATP